MSDIAQNLADIQRAIGRAEADVGREAGSVRLVAVSKTVPAERIAQAIAAGQRMFGENYIQESAAKWPALREGVPNLELHFIGPLQSNKAREAVALFDVVHTLDRPSLAKAIAKETARVGRCPRILVQVNTGEEPQKGGVGPAEADAFITSCRTEYGLPVEGLMCIPPEADGPSPHFALLSKIAARNGLKLLSMGMSGDFEAAIQLGATHVRVGTAIFGARAKAA